MSSRTLSKSDFAAARGCDAKLYFRENRFPDNRTDDEYLRLLAEGGYMVEALARAKRPDGILLESTGDPLRDSARTLEFLSRENVTLFQATFIWQRRLVRVDILEKRGDVIKLIEVKAKSFDGAAHHASLAKGGAGAFRGMRKPFGILATWIPKFEDIAYQTLIVERAVPGITVRPYLLLVDKSKRSRIDDLPKLFNIERAAGGDGRTRLISVAFTGTQSQLDAIDLLTEVDGSAEVAELRDGVDGEASRFEALLDAPHDAIAITPGAKCGDCEYRLNGRPTVSGFAQCWGALAGTDPHALELFSIGQVKVDGTPVIETMFRDGKASLFDIPEAALAKKDGTIGPQAERQLRQIRQMRANQQWIAPALAGKVSALQYPLHFIDFEACRLALPYHSGMRPYGQVAFQWSCHTVDAPGAQPRHREWLNDGELWPNATFARTLRDAIGDSATVLTWSPFESATLNEHAKEHANFGAFDQDLVSWVDTLGATRIVDLLKWATNDFYHPGMRGRTSIKIVLDALWKSDGAMREQFTAWTGAQASITEDPYHALPTLEIAGVRQDVHEGTGAIRAYEAMMYGAEKTDVGAKAKWRELLLQYCKLDTLSMVLVFEYWRRLTAPA